MKAAMLSSEYPPKWGGVGVVAYFHAITLAKEHGVDFDVLTRKMTGDVPKMPKNIKMHMVPFKKLPMYFATSFGKNAVRAMSRMKGKWDICHIEGNMTLLDEKLYRDIKMPIITTMHGTWKGERSEMRFKDVSMTSKGMNDLAVMYLSPRFDKYEDYAIKHSDVVVAISEQEEKALKERNVADMKGRIVRIHHGVDTEIFDPDRYTMSVKNRHGILKHQPMVLFVGRLAGRKGLDTLVEGIEGIAKGDRKARFVIIGTGPRLGMLKKEARRRGFFDRMSLVGALDFEDLARHYATADVVLFPSRWEGYGLITLEAMSSGTPVVASRAGAAEEIITNGRDGYLIDIGDSNALAEKALKLLSSPDRCKEFGRLARSKIEKKYTWSNVARKYYELYKEIMD